MIQLDSLGCETRGDIESLLHSPLINRGEVRSNGLHHSHHRAGRKTQAGEFHFTGISGAQMFVSSSYDYVFHFDFLIK